jgi:hypothetical protein
VEAWLAADHGWSTGTERTYRSVIRTSVLPAFGQLTLQEVTPGRISQALTAIAKTSGPGAAKTTQACPSGMFSLAIDDGAVTANPVRDARVRIDTTAKKAPRGADLRADHPAGRAHPVQSACLGARSGRPGRLDARHGRPDR